MRITTFSARAVALVGILSSASLILPMSASAGSTKVSCDGFALGFGLPSVSVTCSSDTVTQGRYSCDRKEMYVNGAAYLLEAVYDVAGHNSYFPQTSTREGFEASFGQLKVSDWGPRMSVGGFQTETFKLLGDPHPGAQCFAFDKYTGIPHGELEGSPGYTRKAYGFFCSDSMVEADKRDATIAVVLQQLRVPSD